MADCIFWSVITAIVTALVVGWVGCNEISRLSDERDHLLKVHEKLATENNRLEGNLRAVSAERDDAMTKLASIKKALGTEDQT
jgi:hypothetical protein